ncbi:MAG: hypothetical protein JWO39_1834 [Gemmatimonadetes bacterium]|nr:hypothetical protein [Gemmatimonadota bacterium]
MSAVAVRYPPEGRDSRAASLLNELLPVAESRAHNL